MRDQDMLAQLRLVGPGRAGPAVKASPANTRLARATQFNDFRPVRRAPARLGRGVGSGGWRARCVARDVLHSSGTDLDHKISVTPQSIPRFEAAGADNGPQVAAHHRGCRPVRVADVKRAVVDTDGRPVPRWKPRGCERNLGLGRGVVEDQGGFLCLASCFEHRQGSQ